METAALQPSPSPPPSTWTLSDYPLPLMSRDQCPPQDSFKLMEQQLSPIRMGLSPVSGGTELSPAANIVEMEQIVKMVSHVVTNTQQQWTTHHT